MRKPLGILAVCALALMLSASVASAAQFDGFQNATSEGDSTTFSLNIKGDAFEIVYVRWEQPPGVLVASIAVQLDATGRYMGSWVVQTAAEAGIKDILKLENASSVVVDNDPGYWPSVKALTREPRRMGPTLSEWGIIALATLLVAVGTIAIVRRRQQMIA